MNKDMIKRYNYIRILTCALFFFYVSYNLKSHAQYQYVGVRFETAEQLGTYSNDFVTAQLTRSAGLEYHSPLLVHERLNYAITEEEAETEPFKDYPGAGPAMYFCIKFERSMLLNIKTANLPKLMNGVYLHVAVRRKNKFYVIYSCVGNGYPSLDDVTDYNLFYNGGLNLDVSLACKPEEYFIIISGLNARNGGINYGYMSMAFSGKPTPVDQPANSFLNLDVLPQRPTYPQNIPPIEDQTKETKNPLKLTNNIPYIYSLTYTNADSTSYIEAIKYYDGLGRLKQIVNRDVTPTYKDVIETYDYDSNDRLIKSWLPTRVPGNNEGAYVKDYSGNGFSYYQDSAYTSFFYGHPNINREIRTYQPGMDYKLWDKYSEQKYLFNKNQLDELTCIMFKATNHSAPSISMNGYYKNGELYVTKIIDEQGFTSYTFRDKSEKTILIRQIQDQLTYDTYYVYDYFDNLIAVFPPKATDLIKNDTNQLKEGSLVYNTLAYINIYDSFNRCIAKKLPGCDWAYYIYDKADNLILTQNGEQRSNGKNEWTFSLPDILGRPVLTGVCNNSLNYAVDPLKNIIVKAQWSKENNIYKGYKVNGINLINPVVFLVNYFDNYEFVGLNNIPNDENIKYSTPETGYGRQHIGLYQGLLTGTSTAIIDAGNVSTYIYSAMYYDDRGRVIQVKSNNHLPGGIEKEYLAYNFTGQITEKKHVHSATGKPNQTEIYKYTYDHAGRLLNTTHQLNAGSIVTLAADTYDEIGRLKTNMKNNNTNLQTTYTYNVRSATTSILNNNFQEHLNFHYNGNVSEMSWIVNQKKRSYSYSYDNLSQLTKAVYTGDDKGNYDTEYSYDKHGNILTLKRYGKTTTTKYDLVDNLVLTYKGNQLTKVDDAVANFALPESNDFKNYTTNATEYYYNANGSMYKDLNKGISNIKYNFINLPSVVDIKNPAAEARNEYTYSAGGQKLRVVQKWNPNFNSAPVVGSDISLSSLTDSKTTDYVGNIIYEAEKIGTNPATSKTRILINGGYIEAGIYYFYLTDHLGNNRVVAKADGTVIQRNHYYPFGMTFAETPLAEQKLQPYKYNNKEFDSMHGLNLYDYSARHMDATLGRFTSVDPLAEKYYSWSPYVYCYNNPLKYIDPSGMIVEDSDSIFYNQKQSLNNNLSVINELLKGNISTDIAKLLTGLKNKYTSILKEYKALEKSSQIYNVYSGGLSNDGGTYYEQGKVMIEIGSGASVGLIDHELNHAYQYEKNKISFLPGGKGYGTAYDLSDERDAYNRQQFLDAGNTSTGYNYLNQLYIRELTNSDIINMGASMLPPAYQNLPQGPINVNKIMRQQVKEAGKLRLPIPHIYHHAIKDYQKK